MPLKKSIPEVKVTAKNIRLMQLVAKGKTNRQIAKSLGLSEQTIKNELTSLFGKLEASNRTHLIIIAIKTGWVKV
ncbi:MAG: LuxR C-terminal-related transcriptional regulator [Chloroflexi bacterium]|nr:LuxR C-terminal-related transcriptional regulator [Chloroflexota bacterium]